MNARTSRSAKAGPGSTDNHDQQSGLEPDLLFDDLLDARFDEQGRLSQVGRGSRQRIAERLDPRPPATSADELERAVRKLAEGLDAIERQSRTPARPEARAARSDADSRDFVTYSLDRLEARLEALSQRLQSRAANAETAHETQAAGEPEAESAPQPRDDPSLAVGPDYAAESAALWRLADAEAQHARREAETERVRREAEAAAEQAMREAEAAEEARREARRRAEEEAAEEARREAEETRRAEAQRRLEEATEARRRAEEAEAEEARHEAEAEARRHTEVEAEARRHAEEQAAEDARREAEAEAQRRMQEATEARRQAEEEAAEARRQAEEAEAEARRQAEAVEKERLARLAEARREAEAAAEMQRQFAEIEARVDALQKSCDENQIEPVRAELIELLHEIEGLSRDRSGVAAALEQIGERLGEMEVKVNAARNMAGNRLGDIQDRLAGLTERLDEVEVEIPGFDAIRENQSAILERFDRMEGLVHHLASPEELLDRVDGLRRQLQTTASQEEVAEIEQHILSLAERLDALPETLSDAAALERIEDQLAALASELTNARQQRMAGAADLDRRLSDLLALLNEVGESDRTPDLSGLEERLEEFGARLDEGRRTSGEAASKLEQRLAALAAAIEEQEDDVAAEALAGLTRKIDVLAEAIEAQDTSGARRDVEALGGKLDQLAGQLAEQAEHLSRAQVQPLEARLDDMQQQLEALAERAQESSDQLRPFAQKLEELSDRVRTLGASDARTPLSLRLAAIEERIAALTSGRGPEPRALQTQLEGIVSRLELLKGRSIDPARLNELFDRVDAAVRALPADRFDRLERRLASSAVAPDRADRLDRGATAEIEEQLERLERRIAESAAAGMSEADIDRLARRVTESAWESFGSRAASDISEERFSRLERKLEEIGLAYSADGEFLSAEDLAELRADIVALRRELRSLPGLGEGEANLGEVLQSIAQRIERLPENLPATTAELEAQVERIAQLIDDPSHSRLALAHIEASLKAIEERLDETRRSLAYRPAREGDEAAEGGAEAVAGVARALSDDVTLLKDSTEASERKTREALDAVQDTLEAVVKRMAFLERDAEAPAERRPEAGYKPAQPPEPQVAVAPGAEPAWPDDTAEPEAPVPPAAEPEEPGGTRSGGGLLSRFTSRQLLKRATGGRAESFTPEPEESEDESDFPLEPGTDAPLSSSLTGAPSSDTEFMSGARRSRTPTLGADYRGAAAGLAEADSALDEDFLTAARRAARAAAAEAADAEGPATQGGGLRRIAGAMKSRRGALIAAALAVAVAFAALQIIRSQMTNPGDSNVAAVPQAVAPAAPADEASPTVAVAPETRQAEAPTTEEQPSAEVGTELGGEGDVVDGAADTEADASADVAAAPPAVRAPATTDPADIAALGPTPEEAIAAAPAPEPAVPELPAGIGPQRLRDAAIAGDPAAAFEVAARYAEGTGGFKDMRTAVSWYERAAEAGLAPAQYRLGSIYEKGLGVPMDLAKAQVWYRRAAEAGNVKAMHNLAVLYAEGAGGEPDLERAAELFRQAAEHGVRDSQFNLAILHARGLGVSEDLIEAYKWFSIAATSGDEESAKRRDIIGAALSESDLAKAQAAAASFEPVPLISKANEVLMPEGGWSDKQDSTSVEVQPVAEDALAGAAEDAEIGSTLSENDLVALVQKLLADKGFDPGPADGLLGRQTMQAILKFQDQAGLPKTGQIDSGLVEALKAASG